MSFDENPRMIEKVKNRALSLCLMSYDELAYEMREKSLTQNNNKKHQQHKKMFHFILHTQKKSV
jgi:hypothetical protein